ncbi:MAG TPA: hypothetical protein PLY93_03960 [Turneriella sp.]|nr:hypothetical protein [Turneriella sp.]
MNPYIIAIEFCSRVLIENIFQEENRIEQLRKDLIQAEQRARNSEFDFNNESMLEDPNELKLQKSYIAAMRGRENVSNLSNQVKELELTILAKQVSINSLAMALLQTAKQGISIVHQNLQNCPNGRLVKKSEYLKNIIWQGRNQAMHYEEGNYNQDVIQCFNNLSLVDPTLDLQRYGNKSKAKEIIDLLDWRTYEAYEQDMNSILK